MAFLAKVVAILVAASSTIASPPRLRSDACTEKTIRRAWHTLNNDEKKAYIDAELCLMSKPSTLENSAAKTRFDDLHAVHHGQAYNIHEVGAFLPWHRMYVHAHEVMLRTECDYNGTIPYWNETIDAGNFATSPVLDPETGFGGDGDGVAAAGCIMDGPMAGYTSRFGPGYAVNDHCIYREVNDKASLNAEQDSIDRCLVEEMFATFWPCVEGAPHAAGHGGVGGLMMDIVSSPGDPIFFLHHAWLDKIWWRWQSQDLAARLYAIDGPNKPQFGAPLPGDAYPPPATNATWWTTTFNPVIMRRTATPTAARATATARPGEGGGLPWIPRPEDGGYGGLPFDPDDMRAPDAMVKSPIAGDPANVTTMGHVLDMLGVVPSATIADVMDIAGGFLCYEYD